METLINNDVAMISGNKKGQKRPEPLLPSSAHRYCEQSISYMKRSQEFETKPLPPDSRERTFPTHDCLKR